MSYFQELKVSTPESFSICDITADVRALVSASGISDGTLTITSLHTTCALTVNENEPRLLDDIRAFFFKLAPPDEPYKHNDLHLRPDVPPDEPENAHAHLIAMLLGNSEVLVVHGGELVIGRYQSVLLLDIDGPRGRTLAVQLQGVRI